MSVSEIFCYFFPWLCSKPAPTPVPTPTPKPIPAPPDDMNSRFLILINQMRANLGLSKLSIDDKLVGLAQSWSESQAQSDIISHGDFQSRIQSVYPNVYAAENVAEGVSSVSDVFNMWMQDSPHYENMIGNYTRIGLGYAVSNTRIPYWTLDLIR
jgi:uncharacterized protein YkwD